MSASERPLRVGVIEYLLNRPLTRGLRGAAGEGLQLCEDIPARLGERLLAGELDVSLAPMGLLLAEREPLRVLPGIGVGCDGPVMSVRLFHTVPLDDVRTVALDASSRSGALLTRVLLQRFEGVAPSYREKAGDLERLLERAEAATVIGDPALRAMSGPVPSIDLGAQWKLRTGAGYVFAMWAFREGLEEAAIDELSGRLHASLEAGERELDAIVDEEAAGSGLARDVVASYLGGAIRYRLAGGPTDGLLRLVEEARALGILPPDSRLPEGVTA